MTYNKKYSWKAIEEKKGWSEENPDLRNSLHKVKIKENETGNKNTQWFNFTPNQTSSDRWKKHVDQWIKSLINSEKTTVL